MIKEANLRHGNHWKHLKDWIVLQKFKIKKVKLEIETFKYLRQTFKYIS